MQPAPRPNQCRGGRGRQLPQHRLEKRRNRRLLGNELGVRRYCQSEHLTSRAFERSGNHSRCIPQSSHQGGRIAGRLGLGRLRCKHCPGFPLRSCRHFGCTLIQSCCHREALHHCPASRRFRTPGSSRELYCFVCWKPTNRLPVGSWRGQPAGCNQRAAKPSSHSRVRRRTLSSDRVESRRQHYQPRCATGNPPLTVRNYLAGQRPGTAGRQGPVPMQRPTVKTR